MKYTLTLWLMTSLFTINCLAQHPDKDIAWQRCYGGTGRDQGNKILQCRNNDFLIVGASSETNGDISINHGDADAWVIRTDSTGKIKWQHSYGGSDFDEAIGCKETVEGNFIISGHTFSNDGDVSNNYGTGDAYLFCVDANGKMLWHRSMGGSDLDFSVDVIQTTDSGFIFLNESTSFDGDCVGNHGQSDIFLVKLDKSGNFVWEKMFGGSEEEKSCKIFATSGGYIVASTTNSTDGNVSANHGNADVWMIKIDEDGNLIWDKTLGGTNADLLRDIEATADRGFVLSANTASRDNDLAGTNIDGIWIAKLDSACNIKWSHVYPGSQLSCVIQTADKGYLLSSFVDSGTNPNSPLGYNEYLFKTDSAGKIQWDKVIGGTQAESSYDVMQTRDGGYLCLGATSSHDRDVLNNHDTGKYASDIWLVKLNATTNVPKIPGSSHSVSVYPNPASGQAIFSYNLLNTSGSLELIVINTMGQMVHKTPISNKSGSIIWNTKDQAPGAYTYRIHQDGEAIKTGKVIISK